MREYLLQALRWNHSFPNRTPLLAVAVGFIVGLDIPCPARAEPAFEWVRSGGSSSWDFGNSVAVDAQGNAYVVGCVRGPADFSGVRFTNATWSDPEQMFIAKYGPDGSLLWVKSPPLTPVTDQRIASSSANGVAVDASGNVYVAGEFGGIITFGSTTLTNLTSAWTGTDILLAKFDRDGDPLWARQAPAHHSRGNAVAASMDGHVHMVGNFSGTASFGGTTLTSAGSSQDAFCAKYDATGNVIWAKKVGGMGSDYAYAVAADSNGNTYVAGEFEMSANIGGIVLSDVYRSAFVARYDANGNVLWARKAGGNVYNTWGCGLAVDANGNACVSGAFSGNGVFGSITLLGTNHDIFVAKYDPLGQVLWAKQAGGIGDDCGRSIATDSAGNIYLTGSFRETASFGGPTLTSSGGRDVFIAKYSSDGSPQWAKGAGLIFDDDGLGTAVDSQGAVFVTGSFYDSAWFGSTYVTGVGLNDMFLAKLASEAPPSAPAIRTQPLDQTVTEGDTVTFTVGVDGTPPLTFQWYRGGNPISFGTNATLTLTNVLASAAGSYAVVVSNAGGSTTSAPATLTVNPPASPPIITHQPQSVSVIIGGTATFHVTADGTPPFSYQWRKGVTPLTGATNATLVLSNLQAGDAGAYLVTVANAHGSATSQPATLTVEPPPVPPGFEWVRSGGSSTWDFGNGVAVDAQGSAYVVGYIRGPADFSGVGLSHLPWTDSPQMFVAKYSRDGSLLWVKSPPLTPVTEYQVASSLANGVAVDISGNVYVAGGFSGIITFGSTSLTNMTSDWSDTDILLAKFDGEGNPLWARQAPTWGYSWANAVTVDTDGSVHIVGSFRGTASFGGAALTSADDFIDAFHAKYDAAGNVVWAKKAGGARSDYAYAVSSDPSGNTYVAGEFEGTANIGGIALSDPRWSDFIAKYDRDGNVHWAKKAGGNLDNNYGCGVAVDPSGNAYLTGAFSDSGVFGGITLLATNQDVFVAKYDPLGQVLWVTQAGGDQPDSGRSIATDSAGDIFVTGYFQHTASFGGPTLTSWGNREIFVARYASDGSPQWAKSAGLIFDDGGLGIAVDSQGAVFVTGSFYDSAWFDSTYVTGVGLDDMFLAKLASEAPPTAPVITIQPQDQTVTAGNTASFTVAADGTPPLSYNWLRSGEPIGGARNAVLLLPNVQVADAGSYTAIVTNSYGSATSRAATLTVHYSLTVNVSGSGAVARSPDQASYAPGAVVTLTAVPTGAGGFVGWSGDASGTANPLTVAMDRNRAITANFSETAVTITIQGEGTVSRSPDRPTYLDGEQVTLTALPARWFAFAQWGDGVTANPRVITIGANNNYTAVFQSAAPLETLTFDGITRTAPVGMPAVFVNDRFVVEPSITNRGPVTVSLATTFTNGVILYSLDGSEPPMNSALATRPFGMDRTVTLRAVAYSADFSQAVQADPLRLVILAVLSAWTAGGGTVAIEPPDGAYFPDNTARVTALPTTGWEFVAWRGDTSGTSVMAVLTMTQDKCVEAVCGTTLATAAAGGGSVRADPLTTEYPYGTEVRLSGVPGPGNYFVTWGNAATGTANPLTVVVTNPSPAISALFAPLNPGQVALTASAEGWGRVETSRTGNRFNTGTVVTLTAQPDAGQVFLGWAGDATGTQNPLTLTLTSSKVITAQFSRRPRLTVSECGEGQREEGFRFTLRGGFGVRYTIEGSFDATVWTPRATVTNLHGTVQFTDRAATNTPNRFYRAVLAP